MSNYPSDPSLAFPERLGRYELLLPIGTGGMATVYLARYRGAGGFERDVAVKVMHAHLRADEESKLHLLDEARLAARIRHPNVVPVLEVGDEPFGLYLVLEYIEGDSLAGLLRVWPEMDSKQQNRLLARIMSDALCGLEEAHQLKDDKGEFLGLVHRDFSPHNILVGVDGVARLTDFSVAKAMDRAVRTRTGLVKGKIGYMSPEQARGHHLDRRCDVWAAGVVMWELTASRRLFPKSDAVSTLLKIVTEAPPQLSNVVPGVAKELEEIVASALEMDVEARCPSALELRRRLERYWQSHDGIADREELALFVKEQLGERLQLQHQKIAEVRELRQRMVEIARDSGPASSGTSEPVISRARPDDLPIYVHDAAPGNIEWNPTPLSRASATRELGGLGSLPIRDATETTIAASAVVPATRPRPTRWALAIALGTLLLTALVWRGLTDNDAEPRTNVPVAEPAMSGGKATPSGTTPNALTSELPATPAPALPATAPPTHAEPTRTRSSKKPKGQATDLKLARDPY